MRFQKPGIQQIERTKQRTFSFSYFLTLPPRVRKNFLVLYKTYFIIISNYKNDILWNRIDKVFIREKGVLSVFYFLTV